MERYLIYDSSCSVCSRLAETIQEATAGKLSAISIRGEQAKTLLDRAYPGGWQHMPYLVTVDARRARAWTGTPAALRLGLLMGPAKALRVWRAAQQAGAAIPGGEIYNASRRRFLQMTATTVTAVGLAGLGGSTAAAPLFAQTTCCNPCGVGTCAGCEFCSSNTGGCANIPQCGPFVPCGNGHYTTYTCYDYCGCPCSSFTTYACDSSCPYSC